MSTKRRKASAKPKRRNRSGAVVSQINTRRVFQRAWEAYYDDNDPAEARRQLVQIENQGFLSDETMDLYLDVLRSLRDMPNYARIALSKVERHPNDPDSLLFAGSGLLAAGQPVSGILFYEKFLELAPEHPTAAVIAKQLAELRDRLPEILDAFADHLPKDLVRIAAIEKIILCFGLGRFDETIKRCEVHLKTYPDDLRIRNNFAESLSLLGDASRSLATLNQTIEMAPENFFARAARSRVLFFQSKLSESDADADVLVTLEPKQISDLTKAAQTFAFRGDDRRIEWAYESAKSAGWLDKPNFENDLLTHLFAVSRARAGDWKTAETAWKAIDKKSAERTSTRENLNDRKNPVGERSGPFYFKMSEWFSHRQFESISELTAVAERDDFSLESQNRMARQLLQKYPEIDAMLPALLDRGDQTSQRFAILLAARSRRENNREAIVSYIQGTRGTDAMRQEFANEMFERGDLPSSQLSMHIKGKPLQIEFFAFEITDQPSIPPGRSEEVQDLLNDAYEALQNEDGIEAERALRQARQCEPDAPDVLNNLAAALLMQDRVKEADRLVDEVIEKYPDYFFGQIVAANRLVQNKKYQDALQILVALQRRQRFHTTEFVGLANSMFNLFLVQHNETQAEHWIGMLANHLPEHPAIEQMNQRLEYYRSRGKLLKDLMSGF